MQYQCIQCDERFEVEGENDKPRCPKCLRQHGLRKLDAPPPAAAGAGSSRSRIALVLAGLVVVGAGGGFAWWRQSDMRVSGPLGLSPIDAAELRQRVRIASGADAGELATLLTADSQVQAFASRAAAGKSSPEQKTQAVVLAIAERAKKQAFSDWSRSDPRDGAPLLPAQVLASLAKDGARAQLYPLEVALLAVAALRSVDVPAMLAEVYRYEGESSALDPSGRLGYFGVALSAGAAGGARVFDAYGGRAKAAKPGDFSVLNDMQALGALFALRAMYRLSGGGDAAGALSDAETAVKLVPSSASARSVRGAVLLASGGADEGSRELDAAAQLRPDAARHNNLAMVALAKGDAARATKEVSLALGEAPDFASAHLTLATVHLASGEREQARAELDKAESLDRDLPALPLAWAELYASSGELTQALAKAEQGVRMRPKNPEPHLMLARIDRQAGRYDDMRREAQQVLALATAADSDRIKTLLRELLGPTALEAPSEPAPQAPATGEPQAAGDHAAPDSPSADALPRLTDPTAQPSGSPGALQLGSGAPRLHLGGTDSKLKLDLSH